MVVIPIQYATTEPAAEPRPGPTTTPIFLDEIIISDTIKKYPANPILRMTPSSNLSLSSSSGENIVYRAFAPS